MRFYEMYFVRNDEIKMLNQSLLAFCERNQKGSVAITKGQ